MCNWSTWLYTWNWHIYLVRFNHSVWSDSLRPHGLQHARPPCPSPTPRVYSNSCPSNHLILCPLLLPPSVFPSIRVFSNESALRVRWPKYWRFSFNISPSNEYLGLISFRMDCLDLLAVQGTLKSLLQLHKSINYMPVKHKYKQNTSLGCFVQVEARWLVQSFTNLYESPTIL